MKKLLALVLAVIMVMAMAVSAQAASITINRDSTWDSAAEEKKATYTYYKILDADLTDAAHPVYTVDSVEKANALPALFETKLASDGKYYVTLKDSATSAADIVAALATMVAANPTLFPGTDVTSDANPVVINGLADNAYYFIAASNGKNLAVQTAGDIEINEKNTYPSINKEQKKAADPTYTEAEIPAEIGTYIDYKVTVSIPADANKDIVVVDKMTDGLQYDSTTGLTYSPDIKAKVADVETTDAGYAAGATWQIKIPAATVIENRGNDIVITYRALVTEAALTDTGRENEVTLTYDEGNYVLKDKIEYTTYFGGIEKVDGADNSIKLEGVKFTLKVGADDFKVSKDSNGFYYPDPDNGTNEVVTDANGLIIIRGLDNAKTYTLTETETNAGYNLLDTPKDLVLVEDDGTAYSTATYDKIVNNKGTELPSTGGIGTTIFYAAGLVMVLGAAVVLISRRKAEAED